MEGNKTQNGYARCVIQVFAAVYFHCTPPLPKKIMAPYIQNIERDISE